MSNEIQVFENEKFGKIRTVTADGETRFVAIDICRMLGHSNHKKAIRDHVAGEDKALTVCHTPGGDQKLLTVNESGLWALILGSKLPYAKEIKHWVTSEVLPTIRAKGYYVNPAYVNPAIAPTREEKLAEAVLLAKEVKKEQAQRIQALEAENEELRPKAAFADAITNTKDGILVRTMANILTQNGYKTGEKRFYAQLREDGFIQKQVGKGRNLPTQKSMELELMVVREVAIHTDSGVIHKQTTYITGKGEKYFLRFYAGVGEERPSLPFGEREPASVPAPPKRRQLPPGKEAAL